MITVGKRGGRRKKDGSRNPGCREKKMKRETMNL